MMLGAPGSRAMWPVVHTVRGPHSLGKRSSIATQNLVRATPASLRTSIRITFSGEQNHAGTTRMDVRKDAGVALTRFCVAIEDRFPRLCGPRTVWTTGHIALDPGAPSIIPGRAEMLFQIRDDDPDVIERLENLLRSMAAEVSAQGRCSVAVERLRTGAPAMMDATFQQAIAAAGTAFAGGRSVSMPSSA